MDKAKICKELRVEIEISMEKMQRSFKTASQDFISEAAFTSALDEIEALWKTIKILKR